MRLTVFGATGGTGTEVVRQALQAGHEVTAVVRDPSRLRVTATPQAVAPQSAGARGAGPRAAGAAGAGGTVREEGAGGLRVIQADVLDAGAIVPALDGADAVASALGPSGLSAEHAAIMSNGTRSVLTAMRTAGVSRLVVVSSSGFFREDGEDPLARYVAKPLLRLVLRNGVTEARRMEAIATASEADWTIMRPGRLLNKPSGEYRTALDRYAGAQVSRANLASAILAALADPATIGHRVNVAG